MRRPAAGEDALAWIAAPAIVYVLGVTAFAWNATSRLGFPLDDAWIHRVYARAFAFGQGFQYNDGVPETGATSPLWIVVSAPAHWLEALGTDTVVLAVKAVAVAFGLLAVVAVQRIGRRLSDSAAVGAAAAILFAAEPRLLFAALSGMETPLLLALWLGAGAALLSGRPLAAAVLLGLTPVTRPEALLLLPLGALALPQLARRGRRVLAAAVAGLALVAPTLLWAVYCKRVSGHWLSTSYHLKARPFRLGLEELHLAGTALAQQGLGGLPVYYLGLAGFLIWLAVRRERRLWLAGTLLLAAPLIYLLGVVGTRKILLEGYYWTRWLDPAALVLEVSCCLGLAGLVSLLWCRGREWPPRRIGIAAGGLALLALLVSLPSLHVSFIERRERLVSDSHAIERINVDAARWIARNTPPGATVGVNDAGAIRYLGGRRTIDLIGLNHHAIAYGKLSAAEIAAELDWLAVFPARFGEANIRRSYEPRQAFEIPPAEYTICDCPEQARKVIYERIRGR